MALGATLGMRDGAACHALALELLGALADRPLPERFAACAWHAARDILASADAATLAREVWPTLLSVSQLLASHPRGDELARLLCRYVLDVPAREAEERPQRRRLHRLGLQRLGALAMGLLRPAPPARPQPIAPE
jgi:hypothetical protein